MNDLSATWIAGIAIGLTLFVVNGYFAHRYRSRKMRDLGQTPPPFLVYLFFPAPLSSRAPLSSKVWMPRPLRVVVGLIVLAGGAILACIGGAALATLDVSNHPHPVGAPVICLVFLLSGAAIAYVGLRLIRMKNDEPMFRARKGK